MKHNKLIQFVIITLITSVALVSCDGLGGKQKPLSEEDAAIYQEAMDLFYENYNEEGLEKINQVVENNPKNADSLALRAAFLLRTDEYDDAKADIDLVFELDQENALGYAVRSWYIEDVEEDYEQAMVETNRALELDPELALAYAQRGSLSKHFEDEIDPQSDYSKAIELAPNYVAAHANLAIDYLGNSDLESALKEVDQAMEINPDSEYLFSLRGLIIMYKDDIDGAITNFTEAINRGYEDANTYFYRGVALYSKGQYTPAKEDFTKAIEMGVENEFIYTYRGISISIEHDYETAAKDVEKALTFNPQNTESLNGAAYMYALAGVELDKALEYATKAVELNPESKAYLFTQAFVYTKLGEYETALPIYNQLIEEEYTYAYYGLGVLQEMQGNTEEAISAFQAFLAAAPNDFMSADAQTRLDSLGGEQP